MGLILLAVMLLTDVFFVVWAIMTKDRHTQEKNAARIVLFALLAALFFSNLLEWSIRYYGVAIYMGVRALLALIALYTKKNEKYSVVFTVLTFIGSAALSLMVVTLPIIFPQYTPVKPTGEYTTEMVELVWTDESRTETFTNTGKKRFVNVLFTYPEERGSYPLVVFSHGAFGFNGTNQSTFDDLASNGYVVASIGHPYHAIFTEDPDGGTVFSDIGFINEVYRINNSEDSPEKLAILNAWLDLRTADINFTLNTIIASVQNNPDDPLFGKIDTTKIGVFGHSLGGAASVEIGRLRDDIGAVIDLDGTMLGEEAGFYDGQVLYDDTPYPVPLLDVYAEDHYEQAASLGEAYYNIHTVANAKEAYQAVLYGAGHMNFTDLPLFSPMLADSLAIGTSQAGKGSIDSREGIETMNNWVRGFFDYALKDGPLPAF